MNYRTILILWLLFAGLCSAQGIDSSLYRPAQGNIPTPKDSTSQSDTTRKKRSNDINDVIYSSASDSLIFRVEEKKMELYGNGELKYKKMDLKSANILIDMDLNRISAHGVTDTSDTAKVKLKGTPVMSEAGEVYEGNSISYDFKTQRGLISGAKNKADNTIYRGEQVKKIATDTYFVQDGTYTTCTADTSHYFFYAKEMKVILKEQIIARWVWLYIGGVPLPIPIPFGVFPNQSGRRSGIIPPAYSQRADLGQGLSHLGYFWAINDYMDLNAQTDLFFKGGYNLSSRFRYAKRYSLSGNIEAGFTNVHTGEKTDPDYSTRKEWKLSLYHNQTITPTASLNANLSFVSSKNYITNTTANYADLLNQQIFSNATFSKSWEETGNYMTINYERTQYLESGNVNQTLPSVYFTKSQSYPFRRSGQTSSANQKWYELIGYSYTGQFQNRNDKVSGVTTDRLGVEHDIRASASPKIGYFNISPNVSYTEKWYPKRVETQNFIVADTGRNADGSRRYKDSTVTREDKGFFQVRSFNFSLAASTKMFGIVQPNFWGIEAIRHTVMPSISYNYQPDFSKPQWGYTGSYTNAKGETVQYDKYQTAIYGGAGSGEQQAINFSLANNFEMKTAKDPTDTTSQERKIQLLYLTLSTGYNFAASQFRMGDMNVSYRTQIGDLFSFMGNSSYSFYDIDNQGNRINRSLLSAKKGFLRMTSFSLNVSTSLSADKLKSAGTKKEKETLKPNTTDQNYTERRNEYTGLYQEEQPPDFTIPWDASLSLNYSQSRQRLELTKSLSLNGSFNFSLTPSLKLAFTGYYDVLNKQLSAPQARIYKDLHCWEMNFTWTPLGVYRGYRFEIRIKAPQLQDIKLERARGQFSGR